MKLRPKNLLITPEARILSASDSEVHLAVDGLFCGICAGRVQSALADLPGVESAECSLETGEGPRPAERRQRCRLARRRRIDCPPAPRPPLAHLSS